MLSYLRDPGHGTTHAQVATNVSEELADGVEDVLTVTSLVACYVQAHRLWTDHPDPTINSGEALLNTVDSIQCVQTGTMMGTSSQLMRARALRLIEKHWGADWFARIPDDMKNPAWSTAGDCSHQLLRLTAANAKQKPLLKSLAALGLSRSGGDGTNAYGKSCVCAAPGHPSLRLTTFALSTRSSTRPNGDGAPWTCST